MSGPAPSSLIVFAPVVSGSRDKLGAALQALTRRERSPFAEVPGTHFARFVFVPALTGPQDELLESEGAFLLFSADFDGSLRDWATAVCEKAGEALEPIMRCWEGFPSVRDPAGVAGFFDRYDTRTGLTFSGYQATVKEVRAALQLRGDLRALAVRAQHDRLQPGSLRQMWRAVAER